MIEITVQRERTTLDLLLWRQFGVDGSGLLEQALEANPGLAGIGAVLPIGTVVQLPDLGVRAAPQGRTVLDLFGES